MLKIAHEYMERMGIRNTQYIIAQHIDREHPHCHIVFNRVDNDGKTISDKNDRYRNEKVCKMLTAKYRLHFANGKDYCIKEERLRPYDRAKHEIYKALKAEVPNAQSWNELKDALATRGINMKFKVSRTTREVQGVKFTYEGYTLSAPKSAGSSAIWPLTANWKVMLMLRPILTDSPSERIMLRHLLYKNR